MRCTPPFKPWEIEDTLPLTRGLLVNFATSMKLGRAIRYGSVRLIQIGWLNVPPADFATVNKFSQTSQPGNHSIQKKNGTNCNTSHHAWAALTSFKFKSNTRHQKPAMVNPYISSLFMSHANSSIKQLITTPLTYN